MGKRAQERAEEIARLREGVNDTAATAVACLLEAGGEGKTNLAVEVSKLARHYLDGHMEVAPSQCAECRAEENEEMSRAIAIRARDLAALVAHAMNSEQKELVDALPPETVKAVMKTCPEYQNDAWWDADNSQMK